jgi:PIN domain nuclease of toxin-antitoxin system
LRSLIVLDSSAVLAVFFHESGAEVVDAISGGALLGTVNLAEVHERMLSRGAQAEEVLSWIEGLECEICAFTVGQARAAAELRSITRPFGLSLGDRACLALAIDRKATVYTTDKVWKSLSLGIQIEVIR